MRSVLTVIAVASSKVVIDKSRGLKKRVAYGRAEKLKSASLHVAAYRFSLGRSDRNLTQMPEPVPYRNLCGEESENVIAETAKLLLNRQK